jgi:hypothetical protein
MESVKLEFPEVVGKTITELSVYDDPMFGREVLVRFSDATQLSVCIGVKQSIDARYCEEDLPDRPLVKGGVKPGQWGGAKVGQ